MAMEDAADVTISTLRLDGDQLHVELAAALVGADIKRTVDGAPTLVLRIHDPNQKLVTSGIFAAVEKTAQIDGKSFELARMSKSNSTLTTEFEDIAVAEMRRHTDPLKVEANTMTRLDFARKLLAEDGTAWINIYPSPGAVLENTKVQLARGTVASSSNDAGFDDTLFDKDPSNAGAGLTGPQVARYAAKAGFSGNDLVIAVAVSQQESGWIPTRDNTGLNKDGSVDYGLWQINSVHKSIFEKYHNNWKDPLTNAQMAYEIFKSSGWRAWSTYKNGNYKKSLVAAQAAVSDVSSLQDPTGTPVGKLSALQRNKSTREALLGGAEDTWTCIHRIFAEINWTCYIDWNDQNVSTIYVGPDAGFLTQPAEINITQDSQGVDNIDYDFDIGKSTATATVTCRSHRWQLPPGTAVNLPTTGLPNPWLIASIDRSFFSSQCTVTLKKPEPALPEPEASDAASGLQTDLFADGDALVSADPGLPSTAEISGGSVYSWPVQGDHKITGKFGEDRPGHKHAGIDIAVPIGTPVYASRTGFVEVADGTSDPGGYGKQIVLRHGGDQVTASGQIVKDTQNTVYAHLSVIAATKGLLVQKGTLIGKSGVSGNASGPCVHFEIRINGKAVDPISRLLAQDFAAVPDKYTKAGGGGGVGAS